MTRLEVVVKFVIECVGSPSSSFCSNCLFLLYMKEDRLELSFLLDYAWDNEKLL